MFCTRCGSPLAQGLAACPACGFLISRSGHTARFAFHGTGADLFVIYLKYILFSIFTLGIYSFWGRTNLRRYVWSQTEFDGDRLEWHGTGMELLTGALKAFGLVLLISLVGGIWPWLLGRTLGGIVSSIVTIAAFAFLIPLILIGSWRYRMTRTSWRGIRFSFHGNAMQIWPQLLTGGIFLVLTLGLYTPWFLNNLRRFVCEHTRFGTLRFRYSGEGAPLFPPFLITTLLLIPTLTLSRYFFQAASFRHFWNNTEASGSRFESALQTMDLLATSVAYGLLTLVTLGLAYPWLEAALTRLYLGNLWLNDAPDFSFVRQELAAADPTGQELAHFLDLDGLDIGIGF